MHVIRTRYNIEVYHSHIVDTGPTLVAQGVSARLTRHILEALLPRGELKE